MVRESEMRKVEKSTDKAMSQSASGTVKNAIEGDSLAHHQSEVDARHRRISEGAYRIAGGPRLREWIGIG
jgi:hypothetical protein